MSTPRVPKAILSTVGNRTYELCRAIQSSGDLEVRCARAVNWLQDDPDRQMESITLFVKASAAAYTYLPLQALCLSSNAFELFEEQAAVILKRPFDTLKVWRIILDWVDKRPPGRKVHLTWREPQQLVIRQTQLEADDAQAAQQQPLISTAAAVEAAESWWSPRWLLRLLAGCAQDIREALFGLDPKLLQQARHDAAADAENRRLADLTAQAERARTEQDAAAAAAQAALEAEQARTAAAETRAATAEAAALAARQASDAARTEVEAVRQQLQQQLNGAAPAAV
jgi:hypothetical protein